MNDLKESFLFECPECHHYSSGDNCPVWQVMLASDQGVAMVTCPKCKTSIVQCCGCEKNDNAATIYRKRKKSAFAVMSEHYKNVHEKAKKQKQHHDMEKDRLQYCTVVDVAMADNTHPPAADACCCNHSLDGYSLDGAAVSNDNIFDIDNLFDITHVYRDTEERSEDGTSTGSSCSLTTDLYDNYDEDGCRAREEVIRKYLAEISDSYIKEFESLDLDPNSEGMDEDEGGAMTDTTFYADDEDDGGTMTDITFGADDDHPMAYDEFSFFDTRSEEEKVNHKNGVKRVCQTQLFMHQMHVGKCIDPNDKGTRGFSGLIGRSNLHDRERADYVVNIKESKVWYNMFVLVMGMTERAQGHFMDYNKSLFDLYEVNQSGVDVKTRIPTSVNEMKTMVTKGAHSILKNFPAPRVFEIGNHACVSMKEVIRIMAGFGAEYEFGVNTRTGNGNMDGLNGTPAMKDLIDEIQQKMKDSPRVDETMRVKTSIGHMVFWSDSFLRCFIKQKDNSVWILTVTVCPPEGMESSHLYTYILAMGKSGEDHTPVTEHFMKEANELMEGFDFYSGKSNKIERMALGMLTWNADRPERQALTHTRKEGTYGKVSGWAVKVSEEFLPACVDCYKHLIESSLGNASGEARVCIRCLNWSFETSPIRRINGEDTNLQVNDKPDKDYPTKYLSPPVIEVGDGMNKQAVEVDTMPEGRTSDLKLLGPKKLNTPWVLQAIRSAYYGVRVGGWTKKNGLEFLRTCNIKTSIAESIIDTAEDHKRKRIIDASAAEPEYLKINDCFKRFRYPDLPMHGMAHGIIPDVMEMTHQIFAKYGKRKSFYDYANPILEDIAGFRLDYCKLKLLPKAAWVGENVMGFARLMCYLYGSYLRNNPLGTSEKAAITSYHLRCMWNAFQAFISVLMTEKPVTKTDIDNKVKMFMSSVHYLHKQHGNLDKKKDSDEGPGQASSKDKFLDELSLETLQALAKSLKQTITGTKKVLRAKVGRVTVPVLKSKLSEMDVPLNAGMTKCDLQRLLRDTILPNQKKDATPKAARTETMCWNGGNWLSFMANISTQIGYLGSLRLIW